MVDIFKDRISLWRQSSSPNPDVCRSLSSFCFCPAHLSRKFARHRGLSHRSKRQAVSHGNSHPDQTLDTSRRQRIARLAYLFRFRSKAYHSSSKTVHRRTFWSRFVQYSLRTRYNNYRSLLVCLSVGAFSFAKSRNKIAHAAGFERQYSEFYSHQRRKDARSERARSITSRTGCFLCDGSRLSRLRTTLPASSCGQFLCHSSKSKPTGNSAIFSPCGSIKRLDLRPDHSSIRLLLKQRLSKPTTPYPIQRSINRKDISIPHQQFFSACSNDHRTLSMPLASRAIF